MPGAQHQHVDIPRPMAPTTPSIQLTIPYFPKKSTGHPGKGRRGEALPLPPCRAQPLAEERIVEGSLRRRSERHIVHPGPARAAADAAAPTGPAADGEPPARIRLPVQRPDVHRLTFVNSYPCGPSERQPHLVPHHVSVGGLLGHALVHEAELGVVVDERSLHVSTSPLRPCFRASSMARRSSSPA